jgi:hypothetical protein
VYCTLSPQLFHLNAPLLDKWHDAVSNLSPFTVRMRFEREIFGERTMHKLTTKLFESGIRLLDDKKFGFGQFEFSFWPHSGTVLEFESKGKLSEAPLRKLIAKLFEIGVLWQTEVQLDPTAYV